MLASAWNGPTIATAVIGGLGLLFAVISLGWQIRRWRSERETLIRVQVSRKWMMTADGETMGEVMVIQALNESAHPVRVTKIGIDTGQAKPPSIVMSILDWPQPTGATLPGIIAPHDAGITFYLLKLGEREAFHLNPGARMRAYVYAANGKRFETPWIKTDDIPTTDQFGEIPLPADFLRPPPQPT